MGTGFLPRQRNGPRPSARIWRREFLLEAAHIPVISGDFRPLREVAHHFRGLPSGEGGWDSGLGQFLTAAERLTSGDVVQGHALLRQAIERLAAATDGRERVLAGVSAITSGDDAATLALAGATVTALRRQGLGCLAGACATASGRCGGAGLAITARCRARLAGPGAQAEQHFEAAAHWHATATRPFERARTELLYGEWLRRARRPKHAREHLRAALGTFEPLRATPWAQQARNELRAAGETVSQPGADGHRQLTPREIQIIRMAGDGATNREIAAQLFLSPRTIDYHLHKIFAKLGIRSRIELARLGYDDDSAQVTSQTP
jgi:DNA-binding CsgD family transcriptional regulator